MEVATAVFYPFLDFPRFSRILQIRENW